MSCIPGKVCIVGVEVIRKHKTVVSSSPPFRGRFAKTGSGRTYRELKHSEKSRFCLVSQEVANEKVFVLKFLQSRNPDWQERVFFAQYRYV